ncbi:MAG: glycosyltransferase family 2 protein [Myxococcota bacterium]
MKPCLVIPFYDHGSSIARVLDELEPLGLPCIIVDDGSSASERALLDAAVGGRDRVQVETHDRNRGKGAALRTGFRRAVRDGHTHALQIDADGQHDARDLPRFLETSKRFPEALVLARPILENSPASRRYGRQISRFWAWVETLSLGIGDPLCGLRCMPLETTCRVLDASPCGDRMDFDPEIAVRLVWAGAPVVNIESRVRYGADDVSHFRMGADNLLITWMNTRLVATMLLRLLTFARVRPRSLPG